MVACLVTKDYVTALKLFAVVCCYGYKDGNGLKLEKIAQFIQVLKLCVEKMAKKVLVSLLEFIWTRLISGSYTKLL